MIKQFIFDFGGVFINLDKREPEKTFQKLGLTNFSKQMIAYNHLYEKGLLSTDEFLTFYTEQFPSFSKNDVQKAWNSLILDFPTYRLEFLEAFCKKNTCYLLSNINDLHVVNIVEKLGSEFYNRFYNCFEKVYYSHEINLRKPDAAIYEYVFDDSKLNPKECFFIDDRPDNIQTAQKMGMHCWELNTKKEDIIQLPTFFT